jgi:putative transcriptional regulator
VELDNRIKVLRAERDWTQEHLAELVGVTRKTINTVERGVFVPSTVLALRLARAFGVPVEQVFSLAAARPQLEK